MNHKNSGLAYGTNGSSQTTLDNLGLKQLTQEIEQRASKEILEIIIKLGYMQGPILLSDAISCKPTTGIHCVDSDIEIINLNRQIRLMYNECYKFDEYNNTLLFSDEKARSEKEVLLDLLEKLIIRLDKVNDGSFRVEDQASDKLRGL